MTGIIDMHKEAWRRWKEYLPYGVLMGIVSSLLGALSVIPTAILAGLTTVCCIFWPLAPFVGFIVTGIYVNVLGLGVLRFYLGTLRSRQPQSIGEVFWGFKSGHYSEHAKTLVMRNVFVFLWGMLLWIPGIVKSYEYSMIPYLMTDFPEKNQSEYFKLSKDMMTGNKMKLFLLDLSFALYSIPFILLGCISWFVHSAAFVFLIGVLFWVFLVAIGPLWNAIRAFAYDSIYEETFGIQGNGHSSYSEFVEEPVFTESWSEEPTDTVPAKPMPMKQEAYSAADRPTTAIKQKTGKLYGVEGEFKGADLTIQPGESLVIGRNSSVCNLVVNSEQVSRKHLTLEFDGTLFYLTDHSTNGTYDLERGPFIKERRTAVASGTYIQLGTRGDIFRLEIR